MFSTLNGLHLFRRHRDLRSFRVIFILPVHPAWSGCVAPTLELKAATALRLIQVAPQGSFPAAVDFDETGRSATLLALGRVNEEMKERGLGFHADQFLEEAAVGGGLFQIPREQGVDVDTGGVRPANAAEIALLIDVQTIAGEGNQRVALGIGHVGDATEKCFLICSSQTSCPDHATVFRFGQNHVSGVIPSR